MNNPQHVPFRSVLLVLGLGLAIQVSLALLAGDIGVFFDEAMYVARADNFLHHAHYDGWLFAPGYSAAIALFDWLFVKGIHYLRIFQMVSSCIVGYFIMQLSALTTGPRSAILSGYIWACYLPLAMYSHRLWPEALFLCAFVPSLYFLLLSKQETLTPRQSHGFAVLAGATLGMALYLKESATFLPVVLALWLACSTPRRAKNALGFVLAVGVMLAPLVAWHYHRYSQFLLTGGTLPENIDVGLNGHYSNPDYNQINDVYSEAGKDFAVHLNKTFSEYGPGWTPLTEGSVREQTIWNLKQACLYAASHKGEFALTRIKKIADFYTPLSFLVRDIPFAYSGKLSSPFIRRVVVVISLLSSCLLLQLGWLGIVRLYGTSGWSLLASAVGYFSLTTLLSGMSRARVPIDPLFMILASGFWVRRSAQPRSGGDEQGRIPGLVRARRWLSVAVVLGLFALWTINAREIWEVSKLAWWGHEYRIAE